MSIYTHAPITWTPDTVCDDTAFNTEIHEKMDDIDVGITNAILKSKIITATRDMTAISGDVAYTGAGFKPTSIQAMGVLPSTFGFSTGFSDSLKAGVTIYPYEVNMMMLGDYLMAICAGVAAHQLAIIKSYDADGFTLTWTKTGSPTGTAYLRFLCFR